MQTADIRNKWVQNFTWPPLQNLYNHGTAYGKLISDENKHLFCDSICNQFYVYFRLISNNYTCKKKFSYKAVLKKDLFIYKSN